MANYDEETLTGYFSKVLFKRLKDTVRGEVHVHVYCGTLIVDIYATNGIVYRYTRDNVSVELCEGTTVDWYVSDIVRNYRKFLNRTFFQK